jgi:6-phosphogluconolactonase
VNEIQIYNSPEIAAEEAANLFKRTSDQVLEKNDNFFTALSGGSTLKLLFEKLAGPFFRGQINWNRIHFFWVDERLVPPNNSQSNFGTAKKILFDRIPISENNIHRIRGENEPNEEVLRYAAEIESLLKKDKNRIPRFDLIFLGMGEDGHTASLFPQNKLLFTDKRNICGLAENPHRQKRITLTKETINNSEKIVFFVTGESKAAVLSAVLKNQTQKQIYPAAQINPTNGTLQWIIDQKAAKLLK